MKEPQKDTKPVVKSKTLPVLIQNIFNGLGRGDIIHHKPTSENQIGQSGVHTFIDDIQDVCEAHWSEGPQAVNRALFCLLAKQEKLPQGQP